jgi:hypothetical protein
VPPLFDSRIAQAECLLDLFSRIDVQVKPFGKLGIYFSFPKDFKLSAELYRSAMKQRHELLYVTKGAALVDAMLQKKQGKTQ